MSQIEWATEQIHRSMSGLIHTEWANEQAGEQIRGSISEPIHNEWANEQVGEWADSN